MSKCSIHCTNSAILELGQLFENKFLISELPSLFRQHTILCKKQYVSIPAKYALPFERCCSTLWRSSAFLYGLFQGTIVSLKETLHFLEWIAHSFQPHVRFEVNLFKPLFLPYRKSGVRHDVWDPEFLNVFQWHRGWEEVQTAEPLRTVPSWTISGLLVGTWTQKNSFWKRFMHFWGLQEKKCCAERAEKRCCFRDSKNLTLKSQTNWGGQVLLFSLWA